jgi:hypothetical protein
MSKKMLSRKKRAVARIRKSGPLGLSASLLLTANPALANGGFANFSSTGGQGLTGIHPAVALQHHGFSAAGLPGNAFSNVGRAGSVTAVPNSQNFASFSHAQTLTHQLQSHVAGANVNWAQATVGNAYHVNSLQALAINGATLDLQSANANIILGARLFASAQSATINVGGVSQTFRAGQRATAAEYLAITEVLAQGSQTIVVDNKGVAVGGNFALNTSVIAHASEIVIPANVTALDNLASGSSFTLKGDLLNYGSLYTYSSSSATLSGTIAAKGIVNEAGGLISTQLPSSLVSAVGAAVDNTNLTLSAAGSLVNAGTISSGGTLSLVSGAGHISNTGIVQSLNGNIDLSAAKGGTSLTVAAAGGSFQALNGDINIRDTSYSGGANTTLSGGDYLSHNFNIYSGTGTITGAVNNITGQLNSQAGVEHLNARASNLLLGANTVSGDPTFVNDGDITISSTNTFSEDVTIIANGNITASVGGEIIAHGHNVTLIAGVSPGAGSPSAGGTLEGAPGITGSTTVDFASAANKGGDITYSSFSPTTFIDTSGSNSNGGNVTLAAFAQGATGGNVLLAPSSFIITSALTQTFTPGLGGNVTVIAGAAPSAGSNTVTLGNITTSGGYAMQSSLQGQGGAVTVTTAQPTTTTGSTITYNQNGAVTSGNALTAAPTISQNAQVLVSGTVLTGLNPPTGSVGVNGGNISVHAGGNIVTAALQANGSNGSSYTFNNIPFTNAGANGGNIDLTSDTGAVHVTGAIVDDGGIGAKGIGVNVSPGNGAVGGKGGTISISAASDVSLGSVSNSGGAGGSASNSGFTPTPTKGASGGAGGASGSITITSNAGNITASTITETGGAAGAGGSGGSIAGPVFAPGVGGTGGAGGSGGTVTLQAAAGNVSVSTLSVSGGNGGAGGAGGNGGPTGPSSGFAGAAGGIGGAGGNAGSLNLSGQTLSASGSAIAIGGAGGAGGAGGTGNNTFPVEAAGNGGNGGSGGKGGNVTEAFNNFGGTAIAVNGGSGGAGGAAGSKGTPAGTVGTNGTTGDFGNINLTGSGTLATSYSANNLTIQSPLASNGSITLAAPQSAINALTIEADGTGQIVSGGNLLTGQSFTLTAGGGDLNALNLAATDSKSPVNLTLSAPGNVSATLPEAVNFVGSSSSGNQSFSVTSGGGINLTAGSSITSGNLTLASTGATGGITQSDPLSTTTLVAPVISLSNTGSGAITVSTKTADLTLSEAGSSVSTQNVGSLSLHANLNLSDFSLKTAADSSGNGAISLASGTSIAASNSLTLNSAQSGGGAGGITQVSPSTTTTLTSNNINLADSGSGDISVSTRTSNLSASTGGAITIANIGGVLLDGVSAGKTVSIATSADSAGNGYITIAKGTTVSGSSVNLAASESAGGTGGVSQVDSLSTLTIHSPYVTLSDTLTGSAAGSGGGKLAVGVTNGGSVALTLNTTGDVSVQSPDGLTLITLTGNNISVASTGNGITINSTIAAQGNLALSAAGLNDVPISHSLSSANGNISIISADFILPAGVTLTAANGTISLAPTAGQTIGLADPTGSTFGQFNISTAQLGQMSAKGLSVGNASSSGALQVLSDVSQFAGSVTLNSAGTVTVQASTISSANITINAADVLLPGSVLNAGGSGSITLAPSGAQTIGLGDPTGSTFGQFNISQAMLGQLTAGNLTVGNPSTGGDLEILSNISGFAQSLNLATAGNISTGSSFLQSNSVSLASGMDVGSSANPILTKAANVSINAAGSAYVINSGALSINGALAGNAANLSVVTTPDGTNNGAISVSGVIAAGNVTLKSSENSGGAGGISQTASGSISANNLTLTDRLYSAGVDSGLGNGDIIVSAGSTGSLTADVRTGGAVHFTVTSGAITVASAGAINGASVLLDAPLATALTLNNQGTIASTVGNVTIATKDADLTIGGGGTISAPQGGRIDLTATYDIGSGYPSANLIFSGDQSFAFTGGAPNGSVYFNAVAANQSVIINSGATVSFVTDNTTGVLNTSTLLLNGAFNLNNPPDTGNKLVLNSGTAAGVIANSTGSDLDISKLPSLTFNGENLTIISAGNIVDGGNAETINLSNSGGAGGELALLAGFTFSPATNTSTPDNQLYSITGRGTGSILLGATTIDTHGTGSGGNVLVAANGSVQLNGVDSRGGAGSNGNVTIFGSGVTVNSDIHTNGLATAGGSVSISSGSNSNSGNLIIVGGVVLGGTFSLSTAGGNIALGGVDANQGGVTLTTGATGAITSSAAINGNSVALSSGSGGIGSIAVPLSISAATLSANAGTIGNVVLNVSGSTVLTGLNSGNLFYLTDSTGGSITIDKGVTVSGTSGVTLNVLGAGAISMADSHGSISTPTLQLVSQSGAIAVVTNATTLSAQTTADVTITDTASSPITLAPLSTVVASDNTAAHYSLTATAAGIALAAGETLKGTSSVFLNAAGTISQVDAAGNINTPTLVLQTNGSSIGSTNAISTNASNLTASSFNGSKSSPSYGSVNIKDTAASLTLVKNIALGLDNSGSTFTVNATGNIVVGSCETVSGTSSILLATSGGNIDMVDTTGLLNAPAVVLSTSGGTIGAANTIVVNAPTLTVHAYNNNSGAPVYGDVKVSDAASIVTLAKDSSSGIDNAGKNVSIAVPSGSILIGTNEALQASSSLTLFAGGGTINLKDTTGSINAPNLTLRTNGGDIGNLLTLRIATTNLTVYAYDGASKYGNVTLAAPSATVTLVNNAALGLTNTAGALSLTASNGAIVIGSGGSVNGQTSILLNAGSLTQTDKTASLNTPSLILLGTTAIGSSSAPIVTATSQLNATSSSGGIFIADSASQVTLTAINGQSFSLTMTNGTSGSIVIGSNAQVQGVSFLNLTASGSGTIDSLGNSAQVFSQNLTLATAGGSIGATNAILLNSTNLTANTSNGAGGYGDINLASNGNSKITIISNAAGLANAGGSYSLVGNASIVIGNGGVSGSKSITLGAGTASITQSSGSASLNTPVLSLAASGGIGSSSSAIATSAGTLSANAGSTSDSFVTDSAALVTLSGTNTANNYNLTMTGTNGGIAIGASQSLTGASAVNLYTAGNGSVDVGAFGLISAPTVFINTGSVISAGNITASSGSLVFNNSNGDISFSGGSYTAPTALVISASGNIDLANISHNWILSSGTNVLFVAGGNIANSSTDSASIDVSSPSGVSGSVSMIAGATYSYANANSLTLTAGSATGGSILLDKSQGLTSINTDGFGSTSGSVNLIALSGSNAGSGVVNGAALTIFSGYDSLTSNLGSINIIAGSTAAGAAINFNTIIVQSPNNATVTVASATPIINNVSFSNGFTQASNFSYGTLQKGDITFGDLEVHDGTLIVRTGGGSITAGQVHGHNLSLLAPGGQLTYNLLAPEPDANGNGAIVELAGTINTSQGFINVDGLSGGSGGNGGKVTFDGDYNGMNVFARGSALGGDGGTIVIKNDGNLSINTDNSLLQVNPLSSQGNGGTFDFEVTGGNLFVTGPLDANGRGTGSGGSIILQSDSSTPFQVNNGAVVNGYRGTLTVTGEGGAIALTNLGGGLSNTGSVVTADNIFLNAAQGNIGPDAGTFDVNTKNLTINASGFANIVNHNSSDVLNIESAVVGGYLHIDTSASPGIAFIGNTSVAGDLAVTSQTSNIAVTVSAASILFRPASGMGIFDVSLTVQGSGSLIATSGDISLDGFSGMNVSIANAGLIQAAGNINFSSSAGIGSPGNLLISGNGTMTVQNSGSTITLTANAQSLNSDTNKVEFVQGQTFNGNTVINAVGFDQSVQVDDGARVVGNNTLTLNTDNLNLVGSGTISGNPLIMNASAGGGVIASTSSLDLSTLGSLVFHGQSLVLLSSGSITDSGKATSIDLSNTNGIAGSLSIVAGYDFTPTPASGVNYPPLDTTSSFLLTNADSGSIGLAHTTINTSGSTYGGSVLAVATGTIALGSINASGVSGGGAVQILGNGVTDSGVINTSASASGSSAGNVTIASGTPSINGTITATAGYLMGGNFVNSAPGGNILVNSVKADSLNGVGGTISFATNSSTVFIIGSTAKTNINGVQGGLSALGSGGALTVTNGGGGISNISALSNFQNITESAGGTGNLSLGSSLVRNHGLINVVLSADSGKITESGTLAAQIISLTSLNGNIGTASSGFSLKTANLQTNAKGLVNIRDLSTNVGVRTSNAGASYKLVASGTIDTSGPVTAGTDLTIQAGANSSLDFTGNVAGSLSAPGTTKIVGSGNSGIFTFGPSVVISGTNVILTGGSQGIGNVNNAISVSASSLTETSTGNTAIVNVGSATLTFNGSNTRGLFSLVSSGNINVAKSISLATSVAVTTAAGSNGSINFAAPVGNLKASVVAINADGLGNISTTKTGEIIAKSGGSLSLISSGGNIGTGASTAAGVKISGDNVRVNTSGTGQVSINDVRTTSHTLLNSQAGGSFYLKSSSPLQVLGTIDSLAGGVTLIANTGLLSINGQINAGEGSVLLEAANVGNGSIAIHTGSAISTMSTSTTGGDVIISIGAPPTTPVAGTVPTNVTVNQISGGSAYFGKGITANASSGINVINLKGSNVVFNVGKRPTTAISLEGDITITADPVPGAISPDLGAPAQFMQSVNGFEAIKGINQPLGSVALPSVSLSSASVIAPIVSLSSANTVAGPASINVATNSGIVSSLGLTSVSALRNSDPAVSMASWSPEPGWLSDTELNTGEIPATMVGGDDLGIANDVSSILELDELGTAENDISRAALHADGGILRGGIKANVTATRNLSLKQGSAVFAPTEATCVKTPLCDVSIAPQSLVMVIACGQGVAVYNMADVHNGSVLLKVAGKEISLMPGTMKMITGSHSKHFEEINPTQMIGLANVRVQTLDGALKVYSAHFSLPHAMTAVLPLRKLVVSSNPHARKVSGRLLKTAAILTQINAVVYQTVRRPVKTAYLN